MNDPTDQAVLDAVRCYPVPPSGRSIEIDALRAQRAGHGFIVGHDGLMLILNRPWLGLDAVVTSAPECHLPYGSIGEERMVLTCGLIPHHLLEQVVEHFSAALPNEAAAFILWSEATGEFRVEFPQIDEATPSRLVYRTPHPETGAHVICDLHSHGTAGAFFSSTDDADDAHSTKIAIVVGSFGRAEGPAYVARLCAGGMFIPLPRMPFAEPANATKGQDYAI